MFEEVDMNKQNEDETGVNEEHVDCFGLDIVIIKQNSVQLHILVECSSTKI